MNDGGHLSVSVCLLLKDDSRTFHLILLKVMSGCIPWWAGRKRGFHSISLVVLFSLSYQESVWPDDSPPDIYSFVHSFNHSTI